MPGACDESPAAAGEIMLFGVRVVVDSMRKSVSLNNLSQYELPKDSSSGGGTIKEDASASAAAVGYASADDAVVHNSSSAGRERKRGVPWTEEEHKLFLMGLKKVGKGEWRGISRNFVLTRTPTQVASHAQKYFLRRSNLNRRRRRSSLFDITTDTVTTSEVEKLHQFQSLPEASTSNGFPLMPSFNPVLLPRPIKNQPDNCAPAPQTCAPSDLTLSLKPSTMDPPLLSVSLNSSAFHVMSSFSNGDSFISVA